MKAGDMTDGIFLMHIVDALKETIEFTNGVGMTEFLESKLLVRAVTSSFEIAGEATKNLTMEFRDAHPEVGRSPRDRRNGRACRPATAAMVGRVTP